MEKMKVLMIGNHQSVKGGITSVIQQLLSYDWNLAGVKMTFIPTYIEASALKKIFYFIRAYENIRKLMKTDTPDVVHIHMSYKGSFYRKYVIHKLCKRYGVPDIIHLHGSEFQKWYNSSNQKIKEKIRIVMNECSSFIVLGEKWNKIIKNIEPKTNIVVVSNAVHVPDDIVKWNNNRFQILFLGVLIRRKGVEDLIRAIGLLKEADKLKNLYFVIAGAGADEEYLRQLANEQKIGPWIDFVGWVDGKEKEKYLKDSQALVLPSYNEGLPVAVLEAISYGLPVIATDVGDMSAAVKNGENGFLIKPGDISELAKKIIQICTDEEAYIKMSSESKKIAIEEFSDDNYFEKIRYCYQEAFKRK